MDSDASTHQLHVAAFVAQALELDDDPMTLTGELQALKRDSNAGIWTVELESSAGPAAFLVYHYLLEVGDNDGRTGKTLFDADLSTLERAGELDSPGPRILAHAIAGDEAFILATTPATFRALTGVVTPDSAASDTRPLPPSADVVQIRRDAAADLLTLLQTADQQARTWLDAAIGRTAHLAAPSVDASIELNEEEAALALFLLDDRSIRNLLQLLSVLIETARRRAAVALHDAPESDC